MAKKKEVTIYLDNDVYGLLKKRAEKNFLSVPELISDIIRRSIISMKGGKHTSSGKSDDKFIEYFSRRR